MRVLGEFFFWLWTDLDEIGHHKLANVAKEIALFIFRNAS